MRHKFLYIIFTWCALVGAIACLPILKYGLPICEILKLPNNLMEPIICLIIQVYMILSVMGLFLSVYIIDRIENCFHSKNHKFWLPM